MIILVIILVSMATGCQMSEGQINALIDENLAQRSESIESAIQPTSGKEYSEEELLALIESVVWDKTATLYCHTI